MGLTRNGFDPKWVLPKITLHQNYFILKLLLYTKITLYQNYFIPKLLITKIFPPQTTSSTKLADVAPIPQTTKILSPSGGGCEQGGGKQLLDLGVAALHRLVEGGGAIVQVPVGVGAVVEQRLHGADVSLLRRRDERCRAVG
eukprot:scaffold134_cov61-Phaeocystis_antarctica.AAC.6